MTAPEFGSTKCKHCKGSGINPWGGKCDICAWGWVPPKKSREEHRRKAEGDVDPPSGDSMERPDPEGGERGKRDGMDRADTHAPQEWKWYAYQVLLRLCRRVPDLTTDDLYFAIQDEGYPPDPPEPRAFGPLMKRAASNGLIAQTDEFRKSDRAKAHRRPKQVWRVL